MTAPLLGNASNIGMAPMSAPAGQTAQAGQAGQGGLLPSLTQQTGTAGTAGTAGTPGTAGTANPAAANAAAPAAPAGAAAPQFDINKIASQGRWLGPLMAVGGGAAAIAAFSKGQDGSKFLKFGGVTGALSGLALTGIGFKAKGIEVGTQATEATAVEAITQLSQQYETTMQSLAQQSDAKVASLEQQLAMAQQGGTGTGTGVGTGVPGTSMPNGVGESGNLGITGGTGQADTSLLNESTSVPVGPGITMAVVPTNDAFANV
ncbi:MAG: hypothetical protein ABI200_05365, partial [Gaiellales bacterium]